MYEGRNAKTAYKTASQFCEMTAELSQWDRQALAQTNGNQIEAQQKLAERISYDRRFDALDPRRLAERVYECRQTGSTLNLDDSGLRKGGSPTLRNKPGITGY